MESVRPKESALEAQSLDLCILKTVETIMEIPMDASLDWAAELTRSLLL